jgi:hypothetical protein
MKRRLSSRLAHVHGLVGADPLAGYVAPTSIDPALAARAQVKLRDFIARRAPYGSIDYETIMGSRDGVFRWYAFRFAEHPADAGIASPHPGVDYLVGPVADVKQDSSWGIKSGLPVVGVVILFALIMAKSR